ncbi:hypothetical protein NBRC116583_34330 [Arenicella sp. 4NH20-0111]|uniref:DUF5984 family protein n=1 Tax=Arenicella sp. 4NH20-0111 TaxID=3127648 RepID=UPI00310260F5
MALFEFKLKPLEEIIPWGEENNLYLSWFGLTDSNYYMNVGKEKLFEYSTELLRYWSKDNSNDEIHVSPYFDYQVSRLHEDLLAILPNVLQEIPKALFDCIATVEKQKNWEYSLASFADSYENEDPVEEMDFFDAYTQATDWFQCRKLAGIGGGPDILIFRFDEQVVIRWDNSDYSQDGIGTWSASSGEFLLPVEKFVEEVHSFHDKLMKGMEDRVSLIASNDALSNISIDKQELAREQEERSHALNEAIVEKAAVQSWDEVLTAYESLQKDQGLSI